MKLYHYFEKERGPFNNLSDLSLEEAEKVLSKIRENQEIFASKRDVNYMKRRFEYEDNIKDLFIKKKGKVFRDSPHYMTLEECKWLEKWYINSDYISIDLELIDTNSISFTYGDTFPVFGPNGDDSAWYRKNVYTYEEILEKIKKYGLPQQWNPIGENGPIRYIEAQIWSNDLVDKLRKIKK